MHWPEPKKETPSKHRLLFICVAVLASVVTLSAFFGERGLIAAWSMKQQAQHAQSQVNKLERENAERSALAQSLREDTSVVERIAREEHGFARPGEVVYKFLSPGAAASRSEHPDEQVQ